MKPEEVSFLRNISQGKKASSLHFALTLFLLDISFTFYPLSIGVKDICDTK